MGIKYNKILLVLKYLNWGEYLRDFNLVEKINFFIN